MKTLAAAGFNQIGIETALLYGLEDARAKIVAYPRNSCSRDRAMPIAFLRKSCVA
jgi:hypothetical protein